MLVCVLLDVDCFEGYVLELIYGVVDGIECLLVVWLLLGDCIVVEDLCFFGSFNVFNVVGYVLLLVMVDVYGM